MQTENVTAQEIEEWLHTNKKKAAWLAQTIGVTKPTVSRWLNGQDIPEPMQNLLRLLIRGEVPPGFAQPRDPGILAFTPAEWRIIEVARAREGFDDSKEWIVSKIRAYLAMANIKPGPVAYESHEEWQARQEGLRVAEGKK